MKVQWNILFQLQPCFVLAGHADGHSVEKAAEVRCGLRESRREKNSREERERERRRRREGQQDAFLS